MTDRQQDVCGEQLKLDCKVLEEKEDKAVSRWG